LSNLTLDEVLAAARDADPLTRIPEWRDKVAALGMAAVEPLREWLPLDSQGRFAIAALGKIAENADKKDRLAIVEILQGARDTIPSGNRGQLSDTLRHLGLKVHGPGLKVIGGGPIHHVVVDYVGENPTEFDDLYLMEDGFAYSGKHVRSQGGVKDSGGRTLCRLCLDAMKRGFDDPFEKGRTPGAPSSRTWVLRSKWHEIRGWAQGPRVGDVYLTRCWRWILVSGKQVARGVLHASEEETCLDCAASKVPI
jgi:hypothetical protein